MVKNLKKIILTSLFVLAADYNLNIKNSITDNTPPTAPINYEITNIVYSPSTFQIASFNRTYR